MRARLWIFTVLVALALALNLARLSLSVAQTGEDTMRARIAAASNALRGQFDLLDARLAPRAVAEMPDLVELVRAPAEAGQAPAKPDERALRAAGGALAPEPDLFAVITPQGAIVSRRSRPAQVFDDVSQLPLSQTASGGIPVPTFATFDGAVYRFEAARVPGAQAAAVVGTLVDDRLAAQLKSQVDADVTLLQGGKIIASSLPPGEERSRLARWAAAPAPGYGVLQIRLPLAGTALSGRLPRGATRYAVRGALLQLDGGVHAAITLPASPYLAWLGRYQAFYIAGLVLLLLFGFLWGILAKPEEVVQRVELTEAPDGVVSPPRRQPRPSLTATDVGEARPEPPPRSRDVPWSPGEGPSGELPLVERGPSAAPTPQAPTELDPAAPPPAPEAPAKAEPTGEQAWSFAPTAGQFTKDETAEPALGKQETAEPLAAAAEGAPTAAPDWDMPPPPPPPPEELAQSASPKTDFSFAGLLDDGAASRDGTRGPGANGTSATETAVPDATPAAAPEAAAGAPETPFPGDEPTRIEPVSAALLDKLRERDEETAAEAAPAAQAAAAPVHSAAEELPPAAGQEVDPDEGHWRETYDRFRELKTRLGEPVDRITFEKFVAKLKQNRADLITKHHCKGVRFSVYEKDGKAAIKAAAIR